ncbi:hypothetical protein [Paenibacillus agilis]|uniref:Fibronectin type-III domain-containing protein n=1 Tax=Paenibacillus agilis TaxID=3020863 RepID=A0A559IY06_9BACL|nr:hypothetical protein [Paenibacillus agilis]TVX92496.1 hypothetical protein FPZ44_05155 [Paenibacillus agilis]
MKKFNFSTCSLIFCILTVLSTIGIPISAAKAGKLQSNTSSISYCSRDTTNNGYIDTLVYRQLSKTSIELSWTVVLDTAYEPETPRPGRPPFEPPVEPPCEMIMASKQWQIPRPDLKPQRNTNYNIYNAKNQFVSSTSSNSIVINNLTSVDAHRFRVELNEFQSYVHQKSIDVFLHPTAPSQLTVQVQNNKNLIMNWNASTSNFPVVYYIYDGTTLLGTTQSTSFTVNNASRKLYSITIVAEDTTFKNRSHASNTVPVFLISGTNYVYDADGKLIKQTFGRVVNNVAIEVTYVYTYDQKGNLLKVEKMP